MTQKLGHWGPYSPHIWKYLEWACEAILLWNQCKRFEKVTKHQKFFLLWDPKWPRNWAFDAHILHISESSSNAHTKKDWCESRPNFSTKYSKTWILTNLEAPNGPKFGPLVPFFLYTYKSSSNELVNQVSSEYYRNVSHIKTFWENGQKPSTFLFLLIF